MLKFATRTEHKREGVMAALSIHMYGVIRHAEFLGEITEKGPRISKVTCMTIAK